MTAKTSKRAAAKRMTTQEILDRLRALVDELAQNIERVKS